MRKNVSITALLLAALLLFTACQPTPEEEPVIQKDTDKLIEMAVGVQDTEQKEEQGEEQQDTEPVPFTERFGKRFTCDFTTDTSGMQVTGDVTIAYMAESQFPLVRVERGYPSCQVIAALAKGLLKSDELYLCEYLETKESILQSMDYLAEVMADEEYRQEIIEDFGEEYYDTVFVPQQQEQYRELQRKYAQAADTPSNVYTLWDEEIPQDRSATLSGTNDASAKGKAVHVSWGYSYNNQDTIRFEFWYKSSWGYHVLKEIEDLSVPEEGFTTTPQQAVDEVLALFDGLMEVQVLQVLLCDNGDDASPGTDKGYAIRLSPVYAGAGLVYVFGSTHGDMDENGSAPTWWHETLEFTVTDEGIVGVEWRDALKVKEVITEEANLLSFEKINALFMQQMSRNFATKEAEDSVTVTKVTLGLMRIMEKNDLESGLLTPVWVFSGDVDWTLESPEYPDGKMEIHEKDKILCILNAVDGSVLDSMSAY